MWQGPPQKWKMNGYNGKIMLEVINGKWMAKDLNGNIIPPNENSSSIFIDKPI